MANVPQDLRYTKEHEYLKPAGEQGVYFVGITDYAQGELGDVVFVELPQAGAHFDAMASFGTIEAVKAVSDLYAPVSGTVVEINSALPEKPEVINTDPYGAAWMIVVEPRDLKELDQLLDAGGYMALIGEQQS